MALDQTDYTQLNSPTSGGDKMATITDEARIKILGENGRKLYRL